jgi:hypothetical protein
MTWMSWTHTPSPWGTREIVSTQPRCVSWAEAAPWRERAKAEAFRHIVIEYLNETHPNTDPRVCAYCGGRDLPLTPTLPFGVGNRHAWLDQHCAQAWREGRRRAAIEALGAMGIVEPPRDEAQR